jgi:hypothetical protein
MRNGSFLGCHAIIDIELDQPWQTGRIIRYLAREDKQN